MRTLFRPKNLVIAGIISLSAIIIAPECLAGYDLVQLSPLLIDEKAYAGDIFENNITLNNTTDNKVTVYAKVHNFNPEDGLQEFKTRIEDDKRQSLASWVSILRSGIELQPNEEKEVPLKIKIDRDAVAGTYYAKIIFTKQAAGELDKQPDLVAQSPELMIVMDVSENVIERAQLNRFITNKLFYFEPPVELFAEIENIGNESMALTKGISIFDTRGALINSLPLPGAINIDAGEVKELSFAWEEPPKIGYYKAVLGIDYGRNRRTLQDTQFFIYIPRQSALFAGLGVSGFLFLIALWRLLRYRHKTRRNVIKKKKISPITEKSSKKLEISPDKKQNTIVDLKPPAK